ncbi:MAG: hypothetical protein AAGM04_13775, partial [Pseudomonadota bacterium]
MQTDIALGLQGSLRLGRMMDELRAASEDVWTDMKIGVESAIDDALRGMEKVSKSITDRLAA